MALERDVEGDTPGHGVGWSDERESLFTVAPLPLRTSGHSHWRSHCRISALAGCCLFLVLAAVALGLRQDRAGIVSGDVSPSSAASSKASVSGGRNRLHALNLADSVVPIVGIPLVGLNLTAGIPFVGVNVTDQITNLTKQVAETNKTAAEMRGIGANSHGDFAQFVASICFYTGMALAYLSVFCVMRRQFPTLYTMGAGVQGGLSPGALTLFGWLQPTLKLKMEGLEAFIGLDNAMLLEFVNLCIKLFAYIGIPMVVIMCPLHVIYGAEDVDRLSKFSMAALPDGSPVYWVHAIAVWFVVIFVQRLIYNAHMDLVARRCQWSINMPEPRVSTLFLHNIPQRYRSDQLLKSYLQEQLFTPELVRDVAIVKKTHKLKHIVHQLKLAKSFQRHHAKHLEQGCLPRFVRMVLSIGHPPAASIEDLQQQFDDEMERINKSAREVDGINTASAFVTFHSVRAKEFARHMQWSADQEEWRTTTAPAPDQVHWKHLTVDHRPACHKCSKVIGFLCVALLFFLFGPIVTSISTAGELADRLVEGRITSALGTFLGGILPTAGLALFTSFVPSILMLIFRTFLQVSSEPRLQLMLAKTYFWFQVIFVLLVPAVGSSLLRTATQIIRHPLRTGVLLARTLPTCSHFYLTYNVLHLATTCLNLTRYWQFLVYCWHRRGHDPTEARELAEPEDQDYYGIGSRSARWSTYALMGLFFLQLDPIIGVLSLLNFLLLRLAYGYLLVFAETPKLDTGGKFWMQQLWGLQYGMIIYVILMNGVLFEEAGPDQAMVVSCSLFYLLYSMRKFAQVSWNKLPLEFMKPTVRTEYLDGQCATYIQPELLVQSKMGTYTYRHPFSTNDGKGYSALPTASKETPR